MPDFDLSGELSLKIELHMLRPITEKVHSGNGPVSLVLLLYTSAPLVLCYDRFNHGSRLVKCDPVDLVMEDYDITLR